MIPDDDLELHILNPNKSGGQHVGVNYYDLVLHHIPTGIRICIPNVQNTHMAKQLAIEGVVGMLTSKNGHRL